MKDFAYRSFLKLAKTEDNLAFDSLQWTTSMRYQDKTERNFSIYKKRASVIFISQVKQIVRINFQANGRKSW
ncbi:hypothetical protein DK846_05195 [Methanospirillum lacunae]|uniref:Uncharacterized protein n=1 Tax=Methanospirillum lacunae TaxID=668570 RepID=A0A2V2ND48_9EURY|nr:hypothetical protein DK846_05195 [Methanospirillum lacunae]